MFAPKQIAAAAALLMLTTSMAAAAPTRVLGDLNLRAGRGTGHHVITVLPAGAVVDAYNCGRNWCRVNFDGYSGFASMAYLDVGAPVYAEAPPPPPPAGPLAFLTAPFFGWY